MSQFPCMSDIRKKMFWTKSEILFFSQKFFLNRNKFAQFTQMYLPKLSFAYNSTIHKSTGYSPFKLLMGKESKLPIDFVLGIAKRGEKLQDKTYEQFVQEWTKSMEEACGLATLKMGKLAQYNKGKFDERAKAAELVVGDRVLMLNKKEKLGTGKLHSYFEETLFEVLEKRKDLPVFKIRISYSARR